MSVGLILNLLNKMNKNILCEPLVCLYIVQMTSCQKCNYTSVISFLLNGFITPFLCVLCDKKFVSFYHFYSSIAFNILSPGGYNYLNCSMRLNFLKWNNPPSIYGLSIIIFRDIKMKTWLKNSI